MKLFKAISVALIVTLTTSLNLSLHSIISRAAMVKDDNKFVGNVVNVTIPNNYSDYWNQITPENSTKWGSVEYTKDVMNWSQADVAYSYAKSNNMQFKFHTLVWGSQEPGWVKDLPATEQKEEVIQWIDESSIKYNGSEMVDVVNEPLHAVPSYKDAIGGDGVTGWDWVIWSFEQARQKFPNSKLLINEYGIISNPNLANEYIKIINLLKERNLIDGIGIQCHQFNIDNVSVSTMNKVLNILSSVNLPIYVSELDITGTDEIQLNRYKEKFPVLYEHENVKGITLWGWIKGQTWKENTHLIEENGTLRPALQWLKEYLEEKTGQNQIPTQTQEATPTPTIMPEASQIPTPIVKPTISPSLIPEITPTQDINILPTNTDELKYKVEYTSIDWGDGAVVKIKIKNNTNEDLNNWKLKFTFPKIQKITYIWNATFTQTGQSVECNGLDWNSKILANGEITFGFYIAYIGINVDPTNFEVK